MLDKKLVGSGSTDNLTFFKPSASNYNRSSSLFLSLFRYVSFFALVDVIFAKGMKIENPFAFMQSNCSYSFTTIPVIDENVPEIWPAFQSAAHNLINGSVGAITQLNQSIPAPNVWLENICSIGFALQSKCSNETVAVFVDAFKSMFNNDTAVITARKCEKSDIPEKVMFGIMMGIVGLTSLLLIGSCIRACVTARNRDEYDEVEDYPPIGLHP